MFVVLSIILFKGICHSLCPPRTEIKLLASKATAETRQDEFSLDASRFFTMEPETTESPVVAEVFDSSIAGRLGLLP